MDERAIPEGVARRFWEHVQFEPNTGCWLWDAGTNNGYGCIGIGSEVARTHRLSWEIHNGPIPQITRGSKTYLLHRCDVRQCVNPDHLWLGTHADNMADMAAKGRGRDFSGTQNPRARLSETDVSEIRRLRGSMLQREIAALFGINRATVGKIHDWKRWSTPIDPRSAGVLQIVPASMARREGDAQ